MICQMTNQIGFMFPDARSLRRSGFSVKSSLIRVCICFSSTGVSHFSLMIVQGSFHSASIAGMTLFAWGHARDPSSMR